jgi:hypothetical protein
MSGSHSMGKSEIQTTVSGFVEAMCEIVANNMKVGVAGVKAN